MKSCARRFASVLVSGVFLTVLFYGTKRYYVEHLIFSLHYYSFDFFTKSAFGLLFMVASFLGWKLPGHVLDIFYPLAFICLLYALRRVYKQSWGKTLAKSFVLFLCETVLLHRRKHDRVFYRFFIGVKYLRAPPNERLQLTAR